MSGVSFSQNQSCGVTATSYEGPKTGMREEGRAGLTRGGWRRLSPRRTSSLAHACSRLVFNRGFCLLSGFSEVPGAWLLLV